MNNLITNPKSLRQTLVTSAITFGVIAAIAGCANQKPDSDAPKKDMADTNIKSETSLSGCPMGFGWSEGLGKYLLPDAQMSTDDTANIPTPDCAFHQWSWETFVWANALDTEGTPRFMTLPTPADLLKTTPAANKLGKRTLRLGARAHAADQVQGVIEGAGAIVEADGNMLVAKNGYPVYASVHMNQSYFNTAKANLIIDGGYSKNTTGHFDVGAAVIKATWLRLGDGVAAPAGAYVTQAQVPVLQTLRTMNSAVVVPTKGQYDTVDVALVGMHVVGYTENHAEFLWGTFEHNMNAPMVPDNTFKTTDSNPNDFTFYKASTPFSEVNLPNNTPAAPVLSFDQATGTFSPPTNVVQQNLSGGENQPNGVANIAAVNTSSQKFLRGQSNKAQAAFANYNLIGTVWMAPNTYNINSGAKDAIGSVTLANSTAESFFQVAKNTPITSVKNCFTCHNSSSYTFASNPDKLSNRTIALSHVLGEGTSYAVPNIIPVIPKK
jgi:hypothetical protein